MLDGRDGQIFRAYVRYFNLVQTNFVLPAANGGNYQLQNTSPYKNAGTDGKDLGADIAAIQAAIAGVE